jgi:hypothetical protein
MIKRLQTWMIQCFDCFLFEWYHWFMPEWLEDVMADLFTSSAVDYLPEELVNNNMVLEEYVDACIDTHSVVTNNKLHFDFNLN